MFRDEKLELRVGLFIGVGIVLMFLIVFSIKDISFMGKGYEINVVFDYVNGITESAPVRLAGVNVGEVREIKLHYDEKAGKTRVRLSTRIRDGVRIEEDAVARINTLGLLGERYMEISPGVSMIFVSDGDILDGHDPVDMGMQMEKMNEFLASATAIAQHVEKGEGSLGKFVMDDGFYNEMEAFAADIRSNPWKLLNKPRKKRDEEDEQKGSEVSVR
ncbi:MAG: MCE family protein [Candidatus Omnitrophica bacterium]|nr:MCE family protein [Candidatus Omnitrophota bacterium]MBU1656851.1 MCE family protein [Candidatus Omnitrophota bacterium]MBU1784754.1 MCE family protein [Candidatus Omnitrophota bacterium]MBU1852295.1 MCE family protein [Candidatus Omnitrophota bacterium]